MVKIEFGIVSIPLDSTYGGDAYVIKEYPEYTLIAVVDGLGHGKLAHQAAALAIKTIENSYCHNLEQLMTELHRELNGTAGVVLGIVIIDYINSQLLCSGVGNITIKHIGIKETDVRLPKAILGYQSFNYESKRISLMDDDFLIMHTDGIRNDYVLAPQISSTPQRVANFLASKYRNSKDDALIVVVNNLTKAMTKYNNVL